MFIPTDSLALGLCPPEKFLLLFTGLLIPSLVLFSFFLKISEFWSRLDALAGRVDDWPRHRRLEGALLALK